MGFDEINKEMDILVKKEKLRNQIGCIALTIMFAILTIIGILIITILINKL